MSLVKKILAKRDKDKSECDLQNSTIIFLHILKCAGTTLIEEIIRRLYPLCGCKILLNPLAFISDKFPNYFLDFYRDAFFIFCYRTNIVAEEIVTFSKEVKGNPFLPQMVIENYREVKSYLQQYPSFFNMLDDV